MLGINKRSPRQSNSWAKILQNPLGGPRFLLMEYAGSRDLTVLEIRYCWPHRPRYLVSQLGYWCVSTFPAIIIGRCTGLVRPTPHFFTFGLWDASFPDYSAWLCLGSGPPVHKSGIKCAIHVLCIRILGAPYVCANILPQLGMHVQKRPVSVELLLSWNDRLRLALY